MADNRDDITREEMLEKTTGASDVSNTSTGVVDPQAKKKEAEQVRANANSRRQDGGRGGPGTGRGGGKGRGKGALYPEGCIRVTADNKPVCVKHNLGGCTLPNCKFAHVCWWCEATDHNGQDPRHKER